MVISDAHAGLKAAVSQQFTGAAWQRCRVHFMRNLHGKVAAKQVPPVMAAVKTIFAQTEPDDIHEQWDQVANTLKPSFPKVSDMMRDAKADASAFTAFPKAHWQNFWSNNPIEQLNKEIKRRADVVEIFPNPAAFLRLTTARRHRSPRRVASHPTIRLRRQHGRTQKGHRRQGTRCGYRYRTSGESTPNRLTSNVTR